MKIIEIDKKTIEILRGALLDFEEMDEILRGHPFGFSKKIINNYNRAMW